MKRICYIKIIISVLTVGAPVYAFSQDIKDRKYEASISGGALLPGKVQGSYQIDYPLDESVDITNKSSFFVKAIFDFNLKSWLSIGANINYTSFRIGDILYKGKSLELKDEINLGTWDGREHIIPFNDIRMLEFNTSVKGRFIINKSMTLKPCLYLGFRKTFSSSPDAREKGMVVNCNIEYQYYFTRKYYFIADVGILTQPYGGVHNVGYVRSFGVPYCTLGIGFSI